MQRKLYFAYGLGCHAMFLAVYAYMACFVGNLFVPKTIDAPATIPAPAAIMINLALLAAFGLQHSIMARPTFKNWWTKFVAQPIERSTYVLASNLLLIALFVFWQPIDAVVWDVQSTAGRAVMWGLFITGWLMVPAVSLLINHFDLFGTRQVWLHLKGRAYEHLPFRKPLVYKNVRHPLYVGWITAFWAIPTMTLGHLLFAMSMTGYILIAVYFEERNLVQHFGEQYARYRKEVPMLIPRLKRSGGVRSDQPATA